MTSFFPRTVVVLAFLVAALAVPSAAQTPTFNNVIMTPTGSAPWQPPRAAAVGDFDADGKLDAVIVDGSPTVHFMRGNGNGTFARTDFGGPSLTSSNVVGLNAGLLQFLPNPVERFDLVRTADVNGDGRLDAVLSMVSRINWNPYSFSTVLTNTGNDANGIPQFAATHYALNFYDVRSLTVGDLNADAKPDYIVGSAYSGLYVHLNNGSGGFAISQVTNVQPSAGNPAVGPGVIADVNSDGNADFVVTSGQAQSTNIFFGTGGGALQTPPAIMPGAFSAIAVADMNDDAKPDLVGGFGDGSVSVALNNGNGTFGGSLSNNTVAGGNVTGLFVADANGDGNPDVAASLASAARVAILPGNGDGTFDTPSLFGGVPIPMDVTLADFTGDGKADIASVSAAGYGGQNYAVLTNTTVFAPPLPTQTLTILGGTGSPGGIAANVEYYNPATGIWQAAYLTGGHPWGFVPGTDSWINYELSNLSDPGAGPTPNQTLWYLYRVRFTVPTDAVNPKMTFSLKADNFAQVAINGATAGGETLYINQAWMSNVVEGQSNQVNVDAAFSQHVHVGENTITLNIGDWGGLNGFNFRIDLSMQSSQPVEIVPVDPDSDGDGVNDAQDAFPNDPNESADTDGDGTGDNADAFDNDPNETTDSDGDGVGNNGDAFPTDASETTDTDGDGVGNNADAFDNDPTETTDTDGDGVGDNADAFDNDPTETTDSDGDGVGDNGDAFPNDPTETRDSDGDGVGDNSDLYPNDPSASANLVLAGVTTSVPARNGAGAFLSSGDAACVASTKNHGQYVSCVGKVLNTLKAQSRITAAEKDYLQSVAAQSSIGKK